MTITTHAHRSLRNSNALAGSTIYTQPQGIIPTAQFVASDVTPNAQGFVLNWPEHNGRTTFDATVGSLLVQNGTVAPIVTMGAAINGHPTVRFRPGVASSSDSHHSLQLGTPITRNYNDYAFFEVISGFRANTYTGWTVLGDAATASANPFNANGTANTDAPPNNGSGLSALGNSLRLDQSGNTILGRDLVPGGNYLITLSYEQASGGMAVRVNGVQVYAGVAYGVQHILGVGQFYIASPNNPDCGIAELRFYNGQGVATTPTTLTSIEDELLLKYGITRGQA